MKRNAVLAVRRHVAYLRRAGLTERQIAAALTRLRIAPPSSSSWITAGVGPTWTGHGVTRFMEATRHVTAPKVAATARRPAVAGSASAARRGPGFIRAVAPSP